MAPTASLEELLKPATPTSPKPRRPAEPWALYFMLQRTWSPAELQQRRRPASRVAGDRHPCPPDADGPPRSSRTPLGR